MTLPDLDEEFEDLEEEELDRPEDAERPDEDDPLDLATLEDRPDEPPERDGAE